VRRTRASLRRFRASPGAAARTSFRTSAIVAALALAADSGSLAHGQDAPPAGAPSAKSAGASITKTCRVDLIDNGSFDELNSGAVDEKGVSPIAWWRSSHGTRQIAESSPGVHELSTKDGEFAEQPFAAYGPLASSIEIRGSVRGRGRVVWIDGSTLRANFEIGADGDAWTSFTIRATDAAKVLRRDLVPRFVLRLEPAVGGQEARWRDVHALVDLPCPTEAELRTEIVALLKKIVEPWLTRALDDEGPRKTAFVCHAIDAVTGARLLRFRGGIHPLYENLANAILAADVPEWRAAVERFIEDFLTLGLAPETGLPCFYDPAGDAQMLDQPLEIALSWSFLIDVAEHGPEKFRERAKQAAIKIGETVLAHGLTPDGEVAASYYPRDARVNPDVVQLRRFDVLAQLARLSALTGEKRFMQAAAEALITFEFTNYWGGSWKGIDPAFDDDYGHYGARAATIALARPDDKHFRRFAIDGFLHFAPLWRDAMRFGGNVAADQVRCWVLVSDLAVVEPKLSPRIRELLSSAVRSHFKGEQYGDGAWGDVTIAQFDPNSNLPVGDYPGAPQNLLNGLASVYGADLDLSRDEVRAMYTAVMRSSVEHYLRPYGFIVDRTDRRGPNLATGSLRMMLGLVKMLRKL
jgi:hypothetical protein